MQTSHDLNIGEALPLDQDRSTTLIPTIPFDPVPSTSNATVLIHDIENDRPRQVSSSGVFQETTNNTLCKVSSTDVFQERVDDTPRKVFLKRKLSEMVAKDEIKSKKIKCLQKKVWDQTKRINSLVSVTSELNKRNLLSNDSSHSLLESFECNKDLISRLFRKRTNKTVNKNILKLNVLLHALCIFFLLVHINLLEINLKILYHIQKH